MAKYYPVNLALENRKCLVIGAGTVAMRKVKRLLDCRAEVSLISPASSPAINELARKKIIRFVKGTVRLSDLKAYYLVIAATQDRKVNSSVSGYCQKHRILINVVDSPKECNFTLPALVRRGALTIGVSTDDISPALSKKIRKDLEAKFGAEYARFLNIMRRMRPVTLKKIGNPGARKAFFQKALSLRIFSLLKNNKVNLAKAELERILKDACA